MVKKISALILALVLCLSAMVVPVSAAAELNDTPIAFALEWDKEYYKAGDTATLYLYLAVQEDVELNDVLVSVGLNSAFISPDDVDFTTATEQCAISAEFFSDIHTVTTRSTTTYETRIKGKNTEEENATYDWYIRTALSKNANGTHYNSQVRTNGLPGSEIDPNEPFITYTFTVAEGAKDGAVIPAAITSGSLSCNPKQTQIKYYKTPGTSTSGTAYTPENLDISNAVATATIGVEPCEEHTWDEGTVKTAATCGAAGEMLYTCSVCSSTKIEAIDATGNHTAGDPVDEIITEPSCNTAGSKDVVTYCTACEAEVSRQEDVEIPATGDHNYATKVVKAEPTCTADGSYVMACGCGAENTPVAIDALGHDFSEVEAEAVAPTCTATGTTAVMGCSRCDATEGGATVDATGHNMQAGTVVAPTCTADGYTVYTCANNCGETENRDVVTATGHDYETVVTAPTCTVDGYTTYTCDCGDTYPSDTVAATGHDYVVDFNKNPNCSTAGYTRYECTVCEDQYRVDYPAREHKNDDGSSAVIAVAGKPATCIATGLTDGEKCTICNSMVTPQTTIPKTGHSKDNGVVTEPTYSSQGYTTYTCGTCGAEFKDDYVPALSVEFVFEIAEPSITTLRARDSLVLHPVFTGEVADGVTVVWTADNENFKTETLEDGSLEINARKNGSTVFTATVYDAEGNAITSDTVEIVSNAKFFQQFLGFFRALFGTAKYYEN